MYAGALTFPGPQRDLAPAAPEIIRYARQRAERRRPKADTASMATAQTFPGMSERLSRELGAMLDRYDSARLADAARERAGKDEEELFLAQFAELARSVVRPVFEAAGEILRSRGHEFAISEEAFASRGGGSAVEAAIRLRIVPAGMDRVMRGDEDLHALAFTTRHYDKTVCIRNGAAPYEGVGAKSGYPLARIDRQLVEDELLKLMTALVEG